MCVRPFFTVCLLTVCSKRSTARHTRLRHGQLCCKGFLPEKRVRQNNGALYPPPPHPTPSPACLLPHTHPHHKLKQVVNLSFTIFHKGYRVLPLHSSWAFHSWNPITAACPAHTELSSIPQINHVTVPSPSSSSLLCC